MEMYKDIYFKMRNKSPVRLIYSALMKEIIAEASMDRNRPVTDRKMYHLNGMYIQVYVT